MAELLSERPGWRRGKASSESTENCQTDVIKMNELVFMHIKDKLRTGSREITLASISSEEAQANSTEHSPTCLSKSLLSSHRPHNNECILRQYVGSIT